MTANAPRLLDLGLDWSLLSEQRIGHGRVAWLRVGPTNVGVDSDPAVLLLEETGQVPTVQVTNRSRISALLPVNHLLVGGWQTRVVERSVVIAPAATVTVPVRCVERRRWEPRATGDAERTFVRAGRMSIPASARLAEGKRVKMRSTGVYTTSQERVWSDVAEERTPSVTSSYEAISHVRRRRETSAEETLVPPSDANAILVLPDAGGAWLEMFATAGSMARESAACAADLFADPIPVRVARRLATVSEAISWIWRRQVVPVDAVQGTIGDVHVLVSERSSGEVILLDGGLAHAVVSASLAVGVAA